MIKASLIYERFSSFLYAENHTMQIALEVVAIRKPRPIGRMGASDVKERVRRDPN